MVNWNLIFDELIFSFLFPALTNREIIIPYQIYFDQERHLQEQLQQNHPPEYFDQEIHPTQCKKELRLPCTFRGVSRPSDVARLV